MRSLVGLSPVHAAVTSFVFLAPCPAWAGAIQVPGGHQSIQAAIQAAQQGDVITVAPGVYRENVDFLGKAIVLTSVDPRNTDVVEKTVIEGDGTTPTVTFANAEGRGTILRGFTIRSRLSSEPSLERHTLGILIESASPLVEDCRIVAGRAGMQNAIIRCIRSSALFDQCPITVVSPEEPRRLVSIVKGSPEFRECRVFKDGHDVWAYQIDGRSVSGTTTNADWYPDTAGGIVLPKRKSTVTRQRYFAKDTSPPPSRPCGGKRGPYIEIWDAGLATTEGKEAAMVYRGHSLKEAIETASRYVNLGGDRFRGGWPLIPGLDGGPLAPGKLGFGPPPKPIKELHGTQGEVPSPHGVWIQIHPFPPRPMVPRAGGGWEGLSPPAAPSPNAPAKSPAP